MNSVIRPTSVAPIALAPLAADLRSGKIILSEYVQGVLSRIDSFEGTVKALMPEPGRHARLISEALALEARFPDPAKRPPLYGVLVGVKDIFAADGFETKAGSKLPSELFKMPEGPVVSALRRAGALILGKTVTTEFAYFAPGPTTNPWDVSRTPGGSSSGSAAAVAAGFCSLALGTQTIGSISRPAAYCGISGWKPTYERTSRAGVVPFAPSLDHVGLLAPDSAGIALAAAIITAGWDGAAYSAAAAHYARRRPILAIPDGPYLAQAESAALAAFEATVARLGGNGFSIVRVQAFEDIDEINARHRRIAAAEMERTHRAWFRENGPLYAEVTREFITKGSMVDDNQLELDKSGRESLRLMLDRMLEEAGADYWLSPAAPGPAQLGLDSTGSPVMNLPWTHAGIPTLALPTCMTVQAMPVGLQLAGPFGADESLLALGGLIESCLAAPR
jgi:Asp-tRNA(Asn)/Glu-tRNA(Gln) amidotransferase A subunit family amidase